MGDDADQVRFELCEGHVLAVVGFGDASVVGAEEDGLKGSVDMTSDEGISSKKRVSMIWGSFCISAWSSCSLTHH